MNPWISLIALFVALELAAWFLRRNIDRQRRTYLDKLGRLMADGARRHAEGFDQIIPLYEDMISRDPTIAEAVEISRLELIQAAKDLRTMAAGIDLMASTASTKERLAYLRLLCQERSR
jgi:hypothetical protein